MARETRQGWHAAFVLLKLDSWRTPTVILLLWILPALVEGWAGRSAWLVSLLRALLCTPLMFAVLARLYLARLRGDTTAPLDAARKKLQQWRELLLLAGISMLLARLLMFVPAVASWALGTAVSLLAWIPGIGWLLSTAAGVMVSVLTLLASFSVSLGIFLLWLAQEATGDGIGVGALMLTFVGALRFFRHRARALIGLLFSLTAAEALCLLLLTQAAPLSIVPRICAIIVQWLAMWASVGYAAAQYVADKGQGLHPAWDPYAAPAYGDRMKSANPPEQ
jgi:hypothetical protein